MAKKPKPKPKPKNPTEGVTIIDGNELDDDIGDRSLREGSDKTEKEGAMEEDAEEDTEIDRRTK